MESREIVEEWRKKNENRISTFASNISAMQMILLVGILLFLIWVANNSGPDKEYVIFSYVLFISFIAYLFMRAQPNKVALPETIIKRVVRESLETKRREGIEILPDDRIVPDLTCHCVYENDMTTGQSGPVVWNVGFKVRVRGSQYIKEGIVKVHPYSGEITGMHWETLGFGDAQKRDRDIIPVGIIPGNVKTTDFGQPGGPI